MSKTAIRVISLPSSERRRTFAHHAPDKDELPWEFLDASTGSARPIPYDADQAMISQGRALLAGEVGCFSSHYRAWQALLESDYPQMLVLEDDVYVDWPAVQQLLEIDLSGSIEYLRLYAKSSPRAKEIGWLCGRRLVHFLHYSYGTQAYIVTRAGALAFIKAAKAIDRPIDDFMDMAWVHGVPNLALVPYPILELSGPSTVGDQSTRYDVPTMTKRQQISRMKYRLFDKARRLSYTVREMSPAAGVTCSSLRLVARTSAQSNG